MEIRRTTAAVAEEERDECRVMLSSMPGDEAAVRPSLQRSKGQVRCTSPGRRLTSVYTSLLCDPVEIVGAKGASGRFALDGHITVGSSGWVVAYDDRCRFGARALDGRRLRWLRLEHRIATHVPDFRGRPWCNMVGHDGPVGASARGRGRKFGPTGAVCIEGPVSNHLRLDTVRSGNNAALDQTSRLHAARPSGPVNHHHRATACVRMVPPRSRGAS